MRKIKIRAYGCALPEKTIYFKNQKRYKIGAKETQLSLIEKAVNSALKNAELSINDVDCIVSACAVGLQPIPCTAALIHERVAKGKDIPALDINTTCTSFMTTLDTMSYLLEASRYKRILIVSADVPSKALNPNQKESYELFSDGAVAYLIEKTDEEIGIIDSVQKTWSEGAHSTEIRGGLSLYHPQNYTEKTKEEYMFDMNGKKILSLSIKEIPELLNNFLRKNDLKIEDIDMVIPHQASIAMPLVMEKMGIKKGKYIDEVEEYGNMVSASVPMVLAHALEKNIIKKGNTLLLIGTAAGLTTYMIIMKI